MEKHAILIVDDEDGLRSQLKWALADQYQILEAAGVDDALELAEAHKPDVILQDISLTPREGAAEGLDLIEKYLEINTFCKVIMVTGHAERKNALRAIGMGAYDFFGKPPQLEALKLIISHALLVTSWERENRQSIFEEARGKTFEQIIGESESMQEMFKTIRTVSGSDYTILITGESGTGKELVAKAIHNSSPRNKRRFVTINCGAIPENLLESLVRNNWNISRVSRELGTSRTTLYDLIEKYKLRK